jgi:hypothetical protein
MFVFSAIKENLFPASSDKAGNLPTQLDHIKKAICTVAEHRGDGQLGCHIFCNTSDREFLVLIECLIQFKLHRISNMKKGFKVMSPVFLSTVQYYIVVHNAYWAH